MHRTAWLQDRRMKLAGITDPAAANRFIREVYLPAHNARFAKVAALPESAVVAAAPAQLRDTLCVKQERIVARDNTVAYGGLRLQLPQSPQRPHYVKAQVRVAGVWFRRARLGMVAPDSQATACLPSGRNSTYRPVQFSGTGSSSRIRTVAGP